MNSTHASPIANPNHDGDDDEATFFSDNHFDRIDDDAELSFEQTEGWIDEGGAKACWKSEFGRQGSICMPAESRSGRRGVWWLGVLLGGGTGPATTPAVDGDV